MDKSLLDYILRVRLPITIFIILASFTLTYFASRPSDNGVGYSPIQPINFSHKLHAGQMGIDCQYCHTGVEKSRNAMVPAVSTCMNCHSIARKDKPEIIKLRSYYFENKPIQWVRIHKVPDFAYFNHSVHVNSGIKCESCHGDVRQMDRITQMNSFSMSDCLSCHRDPQAQLPYLKNVKRKKFFFSLGAGIAGYALLKTFPFNFLNRAFSKEKTKENKLVKINSFAVRRKNAGDKNVGS